MMLMTLNCDWSCAHETHPLTGGGASITLGITLPPTPPENDNTPQWLTLIETTEITK